jgi:hypothetical protein
VAPNIAGDVYPAITHGDLKNIKLNLTFSLEKNAGRPEKLAFPHK